MPHPPRRPARRLRSKHGVAGRSVMFELGLTKGRQVSAGTNRYAHKLQTISETFSRIASRFLKVAFAIKFMKFIKFPVSA